MAASNQGVSPAPPRPSERLMLGQCCPSRELPVPVLGACRALGVVRLRNHWERQSVQREVRSCVAAVVRRLFLEGDK